MAKKNIDKLKVIPLGGLNEIGKNMTVIEYKNDIIVVDCGMTFPDEEMLGVDIVIPDISYLEKNKEKIRGIVITHGHEDHIGAIPYVLKKLDVPVYGTKLTMGLLENKILEHKLSLKSLHTVDYKKSIKLGAFSVEFVKVCHSIPDAASLSITTPVGVLFFTGDFKIDYTPIDNNRMDFGRIAAIGNKGVLALFADSTNVERQGYTLSEKSVGKTFINLFDDAPARIIVATFASNVHRIQQVISAAEHFNKRVALSGRSMINTVNVARELGYIKVNEKTIIDINDINRYRPNEIVLLTTGSQGEPMSAMTRMANGTHRKVHLDPTDTVILSATPIPGNDNQVSSVINKLMEMGVKVIYSSLADVHVSGHACQEELKLMHSLVRPKFFVPLHGEMRHLKCHANLALNLGMKEKDIVIADNGNTIEFTRKSINLVDTKFASNILVDGLGVGDVGNVVLRDRRHLSEDGLIVVVITLDARNKEVIAGPDIISRGFVYVKENNDLMEDCKSVVQKVLDECYTKNIYDWSTLKHNIRETLKKFLYQEIKRNPMILPVIMEV
ncbi:ribonuclease J [Finegoldia magna]|uniref:ribonuclease J n=1 Tax=Finegoldia magna TaxID=1260 RepID=UPI002907AC8F|nr:ribonuclease J [Finegoldia magna]MDU6551598.1 ribonuclease J [Finegoldia magna]